MKHSLESRLAEVDWSKFDSACGYDSTQIPRLILRLCDNDAVGSLAAARKLWDIVSHQANVGSNAVPTLPFLIDALSSASPIVQEEILDIIYSFACHATSHPVEGWNSSLVEQLLQNRCAIERFTESANQDLVDWSEMILDQISSMDPKQ